MSNTQATMVVDRDAEWASFERLPPEVRRLFRDAHDSFASPEIEAAMLAGQLSATGIAALLKADMRRACRLTYGPDHPQAA